MAKKTDIKVCRYRQCKHESKNIDITRDEYIVKGNMYYHKDCYKAKLSGEWKDENTKKDLQYIKEGWLTHISNTVVYSQLFSNLNDLIARGIPSDYLVFVFDYIVENKLNLRYPAGFKFYVDKKEIKDAYKKHQIEKNGLKRQSDFSVKPNMEDNSPKFAINNNKTIGFNSILGGGK